MLPERILDKGPWDDTRVSEMVREIDARKHKYLEWAKEIEGPEGIFWRQLFCPMTDLYCKQLEQGQKNPEAFAPFVEYAPEEVQEILKVLNAWQDRVFPGWVEGLIDVMNAPTDEVLRARLDKLMEVSKAIMARGGLVPILVASDFFAKPNQADDNRPLVVGELEVYLLNPKTTEPLAQELMQRILGPNQPCAVLYGDVVGAGGGGVFSLSSGQAIDQKYILVFPNADENCDGVRDQQVRQILAWLLLGHELGHVVGEQNIATEWYEFEADAIVVIALLEMLQDYPELLKLAVHAMGVVYRKMAELKPVAEANQDMYRNSGEKIFGAFVLAGLIDTDLKNIDLRKVDAAIEEIRGRKDNLVQQFHICGLL